MKAKVLNNKCVVFPYTMQSLYKDNPSTSFDKRFDLEGWFNQTEEHLLRGFVLVDVVESAHPQIDHERKKANLKNEPSFVGGKWVLEYEIVNKTQEELDAQANYEAGSSTYLGGSNA